MVIGVTHLSVVNARLCSKVGVEESRENDRSDIDENSLILDMLEVASTLIRLQFSLTIADM